VALFVVRRTALGILTLFVVSILIFVGVEVLPGDVAHAVLGRNATPEAVAKIRAELHLDRPASIRYLKWVGGVAHGDLGVSAAREIQGNTGQSAAVSGLIGDRFLNTGILAAVTLMILIPAGVLLGTLAATKEGKALDHVVSLGAVAAISLPEFVVGTLLILVFATWLGILPPVSFLPPGRQVLDNPSILVLPVATLVAAALAQMTRMTRAGVVDVLGSEYVEMARLRGFGERRVVIRFGLRNALAPTIAVIGLNIQWLIGGVVVVETVFGYPGIGQALVQAVYLRDTQYVESVVLLIAAVYIAVTILVDLAIFLAIPKLRTGG
jgi:peptide/nickel transport system permease protein